jgi:hypothetical protein
VTYDQQSGFFGPQRATWAPVIGDASESLWPVAWCEVGTDYDSVQGSYRIARGFIRTPTRLGPVSAMPVLTLMLSTFMNTWGSPGRNSQAFTLADAGFQVWYCSIAGSAPYASDWGTATFPATAPILGSSLPDLSGTSVANLTIPMINASQINWHGDTCLMIRALDETTEPTEFTSLNNGNYGAFFPNGLPCIGAPAGGAVTMLTGHGGSSRGGVRGVGSRA